MSRSNNTESAKNPSTRWFEWYGADDGGFIRYYDKDAKKKINVPLPFRFLLLDEVATVKGWHEASQSGIYANEVRDTRAETLLVRSFKGGELATGFYKANRDRIAAVGGYFQASLYIAYKDGESLRIGNLGLAGAALAPWMEFKKNCPTKKAAEGTTLKGYYVDAVCIDGFTEATKGKITYRMPKFKLVETSADTNKQAVGLDAELQQFLKDYFARSRAEQTTNVPAHTEAAEPAPTAGGGASAKEYVPDGFEDDDIPFVSSGGVW